MEKENTLFVETFGTPHQKQDVFLVAVQSTHSGFKRHIEPFLCEIIPSAGDKISLPDFFPVFSAYPPANVREVVFYKNRIEIIIWV